MRTPLPDARTGEPRPTEATSRESRRSETAALAPVPTAEGFMSTAAKMSLADVALALRDEQLAAHVVHYKAELATSPELDAITAQVVQELQSLQAAARAPRSQRQASTEPEHDPAQLEIELIQTLKEMLGRTFRAGRLATVIERKLGEVSKRFARVFFESELHDKLRGADDQQKTMRFPEQALFHTFARAESSMRKDLEGLTYASPKVKQRAEEQLAAMIKELRNDFLARTTPELNTLVKYLNETLTKFFTEELPPMLGELSWEVVKEARLKDAASGAGYKIGVQAFPTFRRAFEKRFLLRLVPFTEDEMLRKVRDTMGQFRSETIRFVADPTIFSALCEVVCDAVYDVLYNDGFLDLPNDWRARLARGG